MEKTEEACSAPLAPSLWLHGLWLCILVVSRTHGEGEECGSGGARFCSCRPVRSDPFSCFYVIYWLAVAFNT